MMRVCAHTSACLLPGGSSSLIGEERSAADMTHRLLNAVVCILFVSNCAIAQGESSRSDRTRQVDRSGSSGMTAARGSSWEGWLNHGARDVRPEPSVQLHSSDLAAPMAPLLPSVGSRSGFPGLEAGRSPFRLGSNTETEQRGTRIDDQRR